MGHIILGAIILFILDILGFEIPLGAWIFLSAMLCCSTIYDYKNERGKEE